METKSKETISNILGYEGLKIIQRDDILNFSLDSTLLASFVTINLRDKKIIDLGCGNGYIPMFLSLRTNSHIYGVELQEDIYNLAKRSVDLNNLESQITILNADVNDVYKTLGTSSFDIVVSNPPYFKVTDKSKLNKNDYKTIARHEINLNLEQLLKSASILLKEGGTFAMVHRSERLVEILNMFRKYMIEPKRLQFVYSSPKTTDAVAILIEGKKTNKQGELKVLQPLYVKNSNNEYTKEILDIFNYKKV